MQLEFSERCAATGMAISPVMLALLILLVALSAAIPRGPAIEAGFTGEVIVLLVHSSSSAAPARLIRGPDAPKSLDKDHTTCDPPLNVKSPESHAIAKLGEMASHRTCPVLVEVRCRSKGLAGKLMQAQSGCETHLATSMRTARSAC